MRAILAALSVFVAWTTSDFWPLHFDLLGDAFLLEGARVEPHDHVAGLDHRPFGNDLNDGDATAAAAGTATRTSHRSSMLLALSTSPCSRTT